MRAKKQLEAQINEDIKESLDTFCRSQGIEVAHFIEEAILDKLEECEDVSELKKLRRESFKPMASVLKSLKKSDKL